MIRSLINKSSVLFAVFALTACASDGPNERKMVMAEECEYPNTLACEQFAGENYNCTCESTGRLQDIVDPGMTRRQ